MILVHMRQKCGSRGWSVGFSGEVVDLNKVRIKLETGVCTCYVRELFDVSIEGRHLSIPIRSEHVLSEVGSPEIGVRSTAAGAFATSENKSSQSCSLEAFAKGSVFINSRHR